MCQDAIETIELCMGWWPAYVDHVTGCRSSEQRDQYGEYTTCLI